jgi:hypothetical protein
MPPPERIVKKFHKQATCNGSDWRGRTSSSASGARRRRS